MTSRVANACLSSPGAVLARGSARVEMLALLILDADRAVDRRRESGSRGRQLDAQQVGVPRANVDQPFTRADALLVVRGQRRVARADSVVSTLRQSLGSPRLSSRASDGSPNSFSAARTTRDHAANLVVADGVWGIALLGVQPPAKPWRVGLSPRRPAARSTVDDGSARDARSTCASLGAPRRIAGEVGDLVPVGVVGYTRINALCAVHPPRVPARGYQTPCWPGLDSSDRAACRASSA